MVNFNKNMKKVSLIILDGWGHGKKDSSNAVFKAKTPYVDSLYKNLNTELKTDGIHVGLPEGQMGNSEVGHLNIGAGRIVYQDLAKINKDIESKILIRNKVLFQHFHLLQLIQLSCWSTFLNYL